MCLPLQLSNMSPHRQLQLLKHPGCYVSAGPGTAMERVADAELLHKSYHAVVCVKAGWHAAAVEHRTSCCLSRRSNLQPPHPSTATPPLPGSRQVMPYSVVFMYFSWPPMSMKLTMWLAAAVMSAGVGVATPT